MKPLRTCPITKRTSGAFAGLVALLLLAPAAWGAQVEHTIDPGGEVQKVTFDDSRFTWEELRPRVMMSPVTYFALAGPVQLESCRDDDPRYRKCGSRDIKDPNFYYNAALNLSEGEKRLDELAHIKADGQLRTVRDYLVRSQTGSIELARRELAFYRTHEVASLRKPFAGLRQAPACLPAVLDAVGKANDIQGKYKLVQHDWHNCVNDALQRSRGEYPLAAWKQWLSANQIDFRYAGHRD